MQASIEHALFLLWKASWQAAVLILLILAAQWALGRRLNPRWRYGLWLLVLVRLALPWTMPSQASLFNLVNLYKASASWPFVVHGSGNAGAAAQPAPRVQTELAETVSAVHHPAWPARYRSGFFWLVATWSAGALTLGICLGVTHYRISRRVALQRPLIDESVVNLLEDCKQQMRVRVPVTLVETGLLGSPALFGFVRPRLLLPAGLTRSFSLEELRYVFLHELAHIKRRDILVGWLMTAFQIVHWFNPLVWVASHRMRVDREFACDALALSYAREEENERYGQTIIKLLESFGRPAYAPSLAAAVENKNQMKERIRMIAKFRKKNRGLGVAMALFAGLGLVTLTDAQSGTSQADKDIVGTWVLVGRPGEFGEAPAAGGRFKQITEREWSVTQADPETGEIIFRHGGTWTRKGNEYVEHVERADQATKTLVGKDSKFNMKIEGDLLTLIGRGNPWKEVWKRAKADSIHPHKTESSALEGTWRGKEIGGRSEGLSSLTLKGSTLEFHGADTNEWYKAGFYLYDTTPKQMVVVIKECPVPDYVGRTGYAIYELENGTLTISGNEPGFPAAPTGFDAAGARKLVFKQE